MRFQILQPAQLMCHATGLMSLRLECSVNSACVTVSCLQGVARMSFVFSHVEYCDMILCMDFATAMHMLLLKNTKGVFTTEGFRLEVFLLVLMRDTGCLPSVAVRSEREVVRTINTRENILEMVQRSPRLSTRRMASGIGVSRMQAWRTLHEEDS